MKLSRPLLLLHAGAGHVQPRRAPAAHHGGPPAVPALPPGHPPTGAAAVLALATLLAPSAATAQVAALDAWRNLLRRYNPAL